MEWSQSIVYVCALCHALACVYTILWQWRGSGERGRERRNCTKTSMQQMNMDVHRETWQNENKNEIVSSQVAASTCRESVVLAYTYIQAKLGHR